MIDFDRLAWPYGAVQLDIELTHAHKAWEQMRGMGPPAPDDGPSDEWLIGWLTAVAWYSGDI